MASRLRLLMLVSMLPLLAGCGEGSFLQRRFDNFTAHYNTFYNAKRSFWEGVEALERAERPIDQERYIQVFLKQETASQSQQFEAAIEKSADILRDHSRSKWVDDALMLIGKSYFYRQEYVGAEQKFRETIDYGGPLVDEARFWLARTLVGARAFDEAKALLSEVLATEDLNDRWEGLLRLVRGELYVQEEDWESAAEELSAGLELAKDREIESRAQFLLAQVLETMGRYRDAAEAYDRVQDHNPLYELSYAAKASEIRNLGLAGAYDRALALLRKMKRDDKHFSYLDQLELLQARVLTMAGENDEAFDYFDRLLYEPASRATGLKGRLHYHFAELYRDGYGDFFLAAAHFDTAATNIRSNRGTGDLLTPYAVENARETANIFLDFRDVAEQLLHADSLLELGSLDSLAFEARIAEIEEQRREEARRRRADLARRMAESRFRSSGGGNARRNQAAATATSGEYGFLNYRDPVRFQEGIAAFREVWGDRPRVDNWRRQEAINASTELASAEGEGNAGDDQSNVSDLELMMPPLDLAEIPRDAARRAEMIADQAAARYELANILFLSMNLPDSAASWYRMVIEENSELEVARRAHFALAEVQLALGDSLAADRIYRRIVDEYPDTDFAVRARERLQIPAAEATPDSLSLARKAYEAAYEKWNRKAYTSAFEDMIEVALVYPTVPVAGKALVASALIYAQKVEAHPDSLDAPIPVREDLLPPLPDSLTAESQATDSLAPDHSAMQKVRDDTAGEAEERFSDSLVTNHPAAEPVTDAPSPGETAADSAAQTNVDLANLQADSLERSTETGGPQDSLSAVKSMRDSVPDRTASAEPVDRTPDSLFAGQVATDNTSEGSAVENGMPVGQPGAAGEAARPDAPEVVYLGGLVPYPLTVRNLYESVGRHFPGTPYAARARELLSFLDELKAGAEPQAPDSTSALAAVVAADDSLADRAVLPDSLRASGTTAGVSDSVNAVIDRSAVRPDSAATNDGERRPERDTGASGLEKKAADDDAEARRRLEELKRRRDRLLRSEEELEKPPPDSTRGSGGTRR